MGFDRNSTDMMKVNFEVLQHCVLYTFNKLLESAAWPLEWNTAKVNPLYKGKGYRSESENYRGISILPAMWKEFSKILHARLRQRLNANNNQPESQHGIRSGNSTLTAISTLLDEVQTALDASMHFSACSLDFKKAFDSINQRILFTILHTLCISTHFVYVLYQCVVTNMMFVRIDQYHSDKLSLNVDVLHGNRLVLFLFTLLIVDLDLFSKKTGDSVVFYADVLALGRTDVSKPQEARFTLGKHCVITDLEVNTGKTKVTKIRKAGRLSQYDQLTYRNTLLYFVNSFKFLGVILQTKANPTKHPKHLRRKALVRSKSLSLKMDQAKMQLKRGRTLFESLITPSASYCLRVFREKLTESVMQRDIKILHGIF